MAPRCCEVWEATLPSGESGRQRPRGKMRESKEHRPQVLYIIEPPIIVPYRMKRGVRRVLESMGPFGRR